MDSIHHRLHQQPENRRAKMWSILPPFKLLLRESGRSVHLRFVRTRWQSQALHTVAFQNGTGHRGLQNSPQVLVFHPVKSLFFKQAHNQKNCRSPKHLKLMWSYQWSMTGCTFCLLHMNDLLHHYLQPQSQHYGQGFLVCAPQRHQTPVLSLCPGGLSLLRGG